MASMQGSPDGKENRNLVATIRKTHGTWAYDDAISMTESESLVGFLFCLPLPKIWDDNIKYKYKSQNHQSSIIQRHQSTSRMKLYQHYYCMLLLLGIVRTQAQQPPPSSDETPVLDCQGEDEALLEFEVNREYEPFYLNPDLTYTITRTVDGTFLASGSFSGNSSSPDYTMDFNGSHCIQKYDESSSCSTYTFELSVPDGSLKYYWDGILGKGWKESTYLERIHYMVKVDGVVFTNTSETFRGEDTEFPNDDPKYREDFLVRECSQETETASSGAAESRFDLRYYAVLLIAVTVSIAGTTLSP
jgi:hypothetical protein